jgi:hypothetical protein
MSQMSLPTEVSPFLPGVTWHGQAVLRYTGTIDAVRLYIPNFRREGFQLGKGAGNSYLDQIVREPLMDGEDPIPVATVSKQYALVQHHSFIDAVQQGLKNLDFDVAVLPAELRLSEYGERMDLSLMLVNEEFNPGDGNPLGIKLHCLNSVDRSTALELKLSWHRLVCDNGLVMPSDSHMRRVHLGSIDPADIAEYLSEQIKLMKEDEGTLSDWHETSVDMPKVETWADETLTKRWNSYLAARACHIARTGFDGEVLNRFEECKPHERQVSSEREVPGACAPVGNVYHVSQVLSWLAKERRTVQDQFEKMMEIPKLLTPLLD